MYKEKENCIFISANKSFLPLLKMCLSSISENYPNHPDIILCHTDFTESDLHGIAKITDRVIPIPNILETYGIWPIMAHLPRDIDPSVFYARFLIRKWWIFNNYNNVLHLDADTLVMKDLSHLMDDNRFYIVEDVYVGDDNIFRNKYDSQLLKKLTDDSIVIGNKACNGWIFLVPFKYRTKKYYDDIMYLLWSYSNHIKRADQSILNIWLYRNNITIQKDFKYNFQHRLLLNPLNDKILRNAHIIHFNGVPERYRAICMRIFLELTKDVEYIVEYRKYYNTLDK